MNTRSKHNIIRKTDKVKSVKKFQGSSFHLPLKNKDYVDKTTNFKNI